MKKGWEIKKLGEILKIQNGYAFDSKLFTIEKGTPLIRIRDIKEGIGTVTNFNGDYDKKYEVNAGDFLIGMDGEFGCYEWKGETALLNQRVCRLQEFSNKLFPRYLFYGINRYLKEIEDVTAFATVKHISSKQIENIEIHLPPKSEQERIVSFLDEAFEKISIAKSNAEQNLKNARELFESYLQGVFENKEEGWAEKTLGEIADVEYGYTEKSTEDGDYRYIRITDIDKNGELILEDKKYIKHSKEAEGFLIKDNDLLMARTGATFAKVLLYNGDEPSVFASYLIRIIFKEKIENALYWYFTKTKYYWEQANSLQSGAAQPHFNGAAVKQVIFSYPKSIKEQKFLIQKFETLSVETKRLESIYQQKIQDLDELKKSVLQKAFNGELKTETSLR
jgi:type I restriction enzyme S subunit